MYIKAGINNLVKFTYFVQYVLLAGLKAGTPPLFLKVNIYIILPMCLLHARASVYLSYPFNFNRFKVPTKPSITSMVGKKHIYFKGLTKCSLQYFTYSDEWEPASISPATAQCIKLSISNS